MIYWETFPSCSWGTVARLVRFDFDSIRAYDKGRGLENLMSSQAILSVGCMAPLRNLQCSTGDNDLSTRAQHTVTILSRESAPGMFSGHKWEVERRTDRSDRFHLKSSQIVVAVLLLPRDKLSVVGYFIYK